MTTSLFGTTLLVSFLVVGMPHIVPCPAPRAQFAENGLNADGKPRRRRRPKPEAAEATEGGGQQALKEEKVEKSTRQDFLVTQADGEALRKKAHECPVPKPGGRVGAFLGFPKERRETDEESEG
ncbi:MAG: hypothetical protein Q9183_004981 [Haloplaca sp. 2 TL-2023]